MSSPHVLIIGAGMSGLTLAQQLKKSNISISVFERDVDGDARGQGWALSLFGEALDLMKARMPSELGPVEHTSALYPLDLPPQFSFYDITRPDLRVGVVVDDNLDAVRANRRRLRDWLMQGIDVQFNKRLLRVEEHGDKVTAYFEDGTSATGDFLVGAEGTRSAVRNHLLKGEDVMKPLPVGSIFGETSLTGDDFSQQLTLSHSNYIVMDSRLPPEKQAVIFGALNHVSADGKTGYYYYILLWVDHNGPKDPNEKRWFETATKAELAAFAHERTKSFPDKFRSLVEKIPVEGYNAPGFQLQGVELDAEQLPSGRVLLIGDAAHSMAPCMSFLSPGYIEQYNNDKGHSPCSGRKHGLHRRVQTQRSPHTRTGHTSVRRNAEGSRVSVQRRHDYARQGLDQGVELGTRGLRRGYQVCYIRQGGHTDAAEGCSIVRCECCRVNTALGIGFSFLK
jgi:2-polyprenyl-6-methoxyphenol hydroxylase-like FAD-dependent oxidoreductase